MRPRRSQRVLVEEHPAEMAPCSTAQRYGGCLDDAEGARASCDIRRRRVRVNEPSRAGDLLDVRSTVAPSVLPRTSCNSRPERRLLGAVANRPPSGAQTRAPVHRELGRARPGSNDGLDEVRICYFFNGCIGTDSLKAHKYGTGFTNPQTGVPRRRVFVSSFLSCSGSRVCAIRIMRESRRVYLSSLRSLPVRYFTVGDRALHGSP